MSKAARWPVGVQYLLMQVLLQSSSSTWLPSSHSSTPAWMKASPQTASWHNAVQASSSCRSPSSQASPGSCTPSPQKGAGPGEEDELASVVLLALPVLELPVSV